MLPGRSGSSASPVTTALEVEKMLPLTDRDRPKVSLPHSHGPACGAGPGNIPRGATIAASYWRRRRTTWRR
jgi:hypothetical protein